MLHLRGARRGRVDIGMDRQRGKDDPVTIYHLYKSSWRSLSQGSCFREPFQSHSRKSRYPELGAGENIAYHIVEGEFGAIVTVIVVKVRSISPNSFD